MSSSSSLIPEAIKARHEDLLAEWVSQQQQNESMRHDLIDGGELLRQSQEFLQRMERAAASGALEDIKAPNWAPVLEILDELSRKRGRMGFSPSETAIFVLSLKRPLFARLQAAHGSDAARLFQDYELATELLDKLALFTMESFQRSREEVIARQQEEMLELSTPVIKLWTGVLALPLIGTLDSARTSVVMESLLQKIVETGSEIAIIDITGVPMVDTLVAQHLLKTVAAARLMGAECIISGIRPQIAQTIVHLAIDLSHVTTKATLAEALSAALKRSGYQIVKAPTAATSPAALALH